MRTGSEKKFRVNRLQLQEVDEALREGKGLIGGDTSRIPPEQRGLRPHLLDLELEEIPEIRLSPESKSEGESQQRFLQAPSLEIEIGFGGGGFLLDRALRHKETHFVGFEIRRSLCLALVRQIVEKDLDNLRVCYEDARRALEQLFAPQSVDRCSIFFPDPWWKPRHMRRRIFTPLLLDLLAHQLKPGALLHVKTDVLDYGELITQIFAEDPRYLLDDSAETKALVAADQPTERERFCQRKDRPFYDLRYRLGGA